MIVSGPHAPRTWLSVKFLTLMLPARVCALPPSPNEMIVPPLRRRSLMVTVFESFPARKRLPPVTASDFPGNVESVVAHGASRRMAPVS